MSPQMMAIVQPSYGLDALGVDDQPIPSPGPGQIRVAVHASTINPMDWHLATGSPGIVRLAEGFRRPAQTIPGREASGVIDQIGADVHGFEIGQPVFGWMTGAFAQFAIADSSRIWPTPTEVTMPEAAALPVAGGAALQAIELGNVAGKRVVINGASGGVGHLAVQIAKANGAREVVGVCSAKNASFVRELGADEAIDYATEDFTARRWDTVIDCIGNRSSAAIRRALVHDGHWVIVGAEPKNGLVGPLPRLLSRLLTWQLRSPSCHWFVQSEQRHHLDQLATLTENGLIRPHLSQTLALSDIRAAYEQIATGRTVGKISIDTTRPSPTGTSESHEPTRGQV